MHNDTERRRHEDCMRRAIEAAREGMSARQGGPFGAVIAGPAGDIIAVAHNEVLGTQDCTMHAEVAAIRKAGRLDLRGCTLYATGFPCIMCLGAILWSRLSTLYYCNDYAAARAIGFTVTPENVSLPVYAAARAIGFDDAAFLEDVGRIFRCTPGQAEDMDLGHLAVRRLFLPEGAALYDEWRAMPGHQLY